MQVIKIRYSQHDNEPSARAFKSSRTDVNATSSVIDSKLKTQYQCKYDLNKNKQLEHACDGYIF